MRLFDGKKAAGKILNQLAKDVKKMKKRPGLAVVLVGNDAASQLYIKLKKEAAIKVGINFQEYFFDAKAKEEEIIKKIQELNSDKKISGIIVQLPLPAIFNVDKIIEGINPEKDVDGFHRENKKLLEKGKAKVLPVLPQVILAALEAALKNKLTGKTVFALVNSEIFGEILKLVLEKVGLEVDYKVRNTCAVMGASREMQAADAVVSVCGCPNMIKGDMIKEGAVLIDGGITRYHDGKIVGDIDRKSVESKASFLTPVPGGLGPLTVALLLKNVYLATKK